MTNRLKIALLALFLFQVAISMSFELAHDEAYYWIFSKFLDWGYFDHPPFVAFIIKIFSFLPHSEFSVRIGFIILQFCTFIILLTLTSNVLISFLLFFSFPMASFSGILALPDMPLLFMTALYCHQLKKYFERDNYKAVISLGFTIALLLYSKYHGVLLIFFTILAVPELFKRKSFYYVALISLLAFLPHLNWQYQHNFSTLRYHFLERPSSAFNLGRSFEYLILQLLLPGLFVGPIVWYGVFKNKVSSNFDRSMKFICIGTVIFFLLSGFNKKIEANWTIFLAIPLIYLTNSLDFWRKKGVRRLLFLSFLIVVTSRILFSFSPEFIKIKRLTEFHGWKEWAAKVEDLCDGQPILANTYQFASKLSFYLNKEIGSLNYKSRKNQFDYWQFEKKIPTDKVCYLTDKKEFKGLKIETPDRKTLHIIKNQSIEELWGLKLLER